MVKLKRKVALEPKEFLIHLLKKEETEVELDGYTFDYNDKNYLFDPEIKANEFISYDPHSRTFTVEIEEELTEGTKIPEMLEIFQDNDGTQWFGNSIEQVKDDFSREFWLKDGNTMTLIWKDGELVGDE